MTKLSSENEVKAAAGSFLDENDVVEYPGIPLFPVFDMKTQSKSKYFEEKMFFSGIHSIFIGFSLDLS